MKKKEHRELITKYFKEVESWDNKIEDRLIAMSNAVKYCREYNLLYPEGFSHSYDGMRVKISSELLDILEEQVINATENLKNN